MANTVFQLRRNTVSGTRPTTTTVSPGELAINTTDGILFSANATTIFEIGGNLTSTAVGNSTFRSTINSSSFSIANTVAVTANGSTGTSGQVLTSNGTGVYWSTVSSGSVNTAAQYSWTNTHSFASNVTFTSATASGNATSGAVILSGGLGVANNIYAAGRLGFSNSTNISVAYQYYNASNNSIDTVFG